MERYFALFLRRARHSRCRSPRRADYDQFTVFQPRLTVGQLLISQFHSLEIDLGSQLVVDNRQRVIDTDYAIGGELHRFGRQPRLVSILSGHVFQRRNISSVRNEKNNSVLALKIILKSHAFRRFFESYDERLPPFFHYNNMAYIIDNASMHRL